MLFVLDTCKSFSFVGNINAPNIHFISSTDANENAVSLKYEPYLHEHLNDVFSYFFVKRLNEKLNDMISFSQFFEGLNEKILRANIKYRSTSIRKFEDKVCPFI